MSYSQTHFRLDSQAKEQFETIVNKLGMTASTAYTLFVNATIQHQGLPFDVALDPLADHQVRAKVEAELARRLSLDDDPNTKWYSTDQE